MTETGPIVETMEIITDTDMRVLVPTDGSRHYVRAHIGPDAEHWLIDHVTYAVGNGDVVGFINGLDARHFIDQGRADDLGRHGSVEALQAAYAAAVAAQAPADAAKPQKRKKG
jgi:hypothetical protein